MLKKFVCIIVALCVFFGVVYNVVADDTTEVDQLEDKPRVTYEVSANTNPKFENKVERLQKEAEEELALSRSQQKSKEETADENKTNKKEEDKVNALDTLYDSMTYDNTAENMARIEKYDRANKRLHGVNDTSDLGYQVAWLACQMAAVARDQEPLLAEPNAYPWAKIDDDRLNVEYAIMDATLGKYHGNCAYASCNQAACGVIAAVFDIECAPTFNGSENPERMLGWMQSHPDIYEELPFTSVDDLLPGDILCTHVDEPGFYVTHTAIYVGLELAQQKFGDTSAVVYQARFGAGDHAYYPALEPLSDADCEYLRYHVFRPKKVNMDTELEYPDWKKLVKDAGGATF